MQYVRSHYVTSLFPPNTHSHSHTYTHRHTHTHTYTNTYTHAHAHTRTHTRVSHAYIHKHKYKHTHKHKDTQTHTHTNVNTAYTCSWWFQKPLFCPFFAARTRSTSEMQLPYLSALFFHAPCPHLKCSCAMCSPHLNCNCPTFVHCFSTHHVHI